ncbi:Flp family type IVb pilin [Lentzea sp. NPDC051838]
MRRARESDRGATAVEYGLMLALIAVFVLVAVTAIGVDMNAMFNKIADIL